MEQVPVYRNGEYIMVDAEEINQPGPPPPVIPRSTEMWRARAVAKVMDHGGGKLFNAVEAAIDAIPDELTRAAAREAWERGTTFDLDGQIVPVLMQAVGLAEADVLPLIEQANALPA